MTCRRFSRAVVFMNTFFTRFESAVELLRPRRQAETQLVALATTVNTPASARAKKRNEHSRLKPMFLLAVVAVDAPATGSSPGRDSNTASI